MNVNENDKLVDSLVNGVLALRDKHYDDCNDVHGSYMFVCGKLTMALDAHIITMNEWRVLTDMAAAISWDIQKKIIADVTALNGIVDKTKKPLDGVRLYKIW